MSKIGRFLRGFAVALCLLELVILDTVTALSVPSTTSSSPSSGIPGSTQDDVCGTRCGQKPNIIIILADDMGWNDVGFHGSNQIPTPNIDALAYNGVILNKHYVPALCTPSRSALMTGKYPIHLGQQHSVILSTEPRGLPLNEKLLPQYLRDAGYKTHAVGKWHLGFYKSEYLPTNRGFDSHYGYWNGLQDYYTHMAEEVEGPYTSFRGYDMRINNEVNWDASGKYSTDLFTDEAVRLITTHNTSNPMFLYLAHLAPHTGNNDDPLQAPDEEVAKFSYIKDPERRIYAAMVSKLDQSVGDVVTALRNRGMLQNSVIVFLSDNGAPTSGILANHGSNYPLRGIKATPWEGGIRGVAAVWSPLIKKQKRVSNQMFYVTDWLPTLLSAAGVEKKVLPTIDGKDLWRTLVSDTISPRTEILVNIDDIDNYASIRRGNFKYVIGMTSAGMSWEGASGRPQDEKEEGASPGYDPNLVLQSKAGIAIAGVVTTKQIAELKERKKRSISAGVSVSTDNFKSQLLTARNILTMREQAIIYCNVKKEDRIPCDPVKAPCLFDISKDPCEMRNLAEKKPITLSTLENALYKYRLTTLPPANKDADPLSNPVLWNDTWTCWRDAKLHLSSIRQGSPHGISIPIIILIAIIVGLSIVGVMIGGAVKCNTILAMSNRMGPEHDADSRGTASFQSPLVQSVREYRTFKKISGDID